MPIHEFECEVCGEPVEKLYLPGEKVPEEITEYCSLGGTVQTFHKVVSRSSFRLKGTGWAFDGYTNRHEVGSRMAKCRVGLVLSGEMDGSPRVIQEMLACGLPVLVSDRTTSNHFYVNAFTGNRVADRYLPSVLEELLIVRNRYDTRKYFDNNLTLNDSVSHFVKEIYESEGPIYMS